MSYSYNHPAPIPPKVKAIIDLSCGRLPRGAHFIFPRSQAHLDDIVALLGQERLLTFHSAPVMIVLEPDIATAKEILGYDWPNFPTGPR